MKTFVALLAVGGAVGALYWLHAHRTPPAPVDPATKRQRSADLRNRVASMRLGGLGQPV